MCIWPFVMANGSKKRKTITNSWNGNFSRHSLASQRSTEKVAKKIDSTGTLSRGVIFFEEVVVG